MPFIRGTIKIKVFVNTEKDRERYNRQMLIKEKPI